MQRSIKLSCQELRRQIAVKGRIAKILNDDIPSALRFISASTTRFERLIDALLMLSRYGRQAYRSEEVDIRSLVETILDSLRQSIAQSGARITLEPVPRALGDVTALGQVFGNLIGNALKYLQPNRTGYIEIGGETNGPTAHYWVRDNGAGLPPGAQRRLFQVFQRFHPDLAPGEGMGLAIVKRVVERHGGKVWAESQHGGGTTFHVLLPAALVSESQPSGAAHTSPQSQKKV